MIAQLSAMEWARLRDFAKTHTVEQLRQYKRQSLANVIKRRPIESTGGQSVSEAIARECEKWCKQ